MISIEIVLSHLRQPVGKVGMTLLELCKQFNDEARASAVMHYAVIERYVRKYSDLFMKEWNIFNQDNKKDEVDWAPVSEEVCGAFFTHMSAIDAVRDRDEFARISEIFDRISFLCRTYREPATRCCGRLRDEMKVRIVDRLKSEKRTCESCEYCGSIYKHFFKPSKVRCMCDEESGQMLEVYEYPHVCWHYMEKLPRPKDIGFSRLMEYKLARDAKANGYKYISANSMRVFGGCKDCRHFIGCEPQGVWIETVVGPNFKKQYDLCKCRLLGEWHGDPRIKCKDFCPLLAKDSDYVRLI